MGHIRGKIDPPLKANQLQREQKQEQDAKHGSGIILICPMPAYQQTILKKEN